MKIKHVCGCLLLSVLCILLSPLPAQAEAGNLEWVEIYKPGLRGNIVVTPSEVNEIAVGRRGIIYVLDSENSVVYKSVDAGATWENITPRLEDAGAGLPASKIAVAPDTASTVAVVTDSGTGVYLSTDGGSIWNDTSVPGLAGMIQVISISRQYTEGNYSLRDVAIGTADWGDNTTTGQVWVLAQGKPVSSWQDQSLTVDPSHNGGEVAALAFSPNYPRDNTLVVVAATGNDVAADYQNGTWLCTGKRDSGDGTTSWDAFSGYPVEIATASSTSSGDASGVSISASLALPSDYSGTDEDLRQLFVSYDREPVDASDDVYRFEETTTYRLNANGGTNVDISSLAYYGTVTSGKLLAGEVNPVAGSSTVRVRRTSNPFASSPRWLSASAPPSGPGNAKLSWSPEGDFVYCGTGQSPGAGVGLDESAFSMSSNGGDSWQQLSLMDTTFEISDIAPAPDSETLFVATYSAFGPAGIWRSASTQMGLGWYWSRQLTLGTTSSRIILRLSPEYNSDYTIYAAEAGGNIVAVSHNRGNTWKQRRSPDGLIDLVVADEDTIYAALPGGHIRRSDNDAFTWEEPVYTKLSDINMLSIAGEGTVLVGGRNGGLAYSTDGGASFSRIDEDVGDGDVQVVANAAYRENGMIYAATDDSDSGIWRWTIGVSTVWEPIDESITALNTEQRIGGLAVSSEGTLYALRMEAVSSDSGGMTRSLNPATPEDADIEFDFVNYALPAGATFDATLVFNNALPYLKLSGGGQRNDLWSFDTTNKVIYHFPDTLAKRVPGLISPVDNFQDKVNPINGIASDINFSWESPARDVTDYELGIYTSANGTNSLRFCSVSSTLDTTTVIIGPYQSSAGGQYVEYTPGVKYYWRVRCTGPVKSSWSETRRFTVAPVPALINALLSPANGAADVDRTPSFSWEPVPGVARYQFVLADNPDLSSPMVDSLVSTSGFALTGELDYGKTYFWKVRAVEPVDGAWSMLANFTVEEPDIEPPPPVIVREVPPPVIDIPAPAPQADIVPPSPAPSLASAAPAYVWAIIVVSAVLLMAVIVLIVRTR